jgi:hypothetical protein
MSAAGSAGFKKCSSNPSSCDRSASPVWPVIATSRGGRASRPQIARAGSCLEAATCECYRVVRAEFDRLLA